MTVVRRSPPLTRAAAGDESRMHPGTKVGGRAKLRKLLSVL